MEGDFDTDDLEQELIDSCDAWLDQQPVNHYFGVVQAAARVFLVQLLTVQEMVRAANPDMTPPPDADTIEFITDFMRKELSHVKANLKVEVKVPKQ